MLFAGQLTGAAPTPTPQMIPGPAVATDEPYQPQALLPGGIVVPVFPPDSSFLNASRVREAEIYEMHGQVPGRIQRLKNVHVPSIEVHPVERNLSTGAAIILMPGGGHHHLGIAAAGTDMVPYFYNYGITTIILRYRLRDDGYSAEVDAVNDALQAIRLVRSRADEWGIDPLKIGVFGSSAGGEVATGTALNYPAFDAENNSTDDPLAGISSRPDFVGLLYTGPSDITRDPTKPIPADVPPAFIACHPVWRRPPHRVVDGLLPCDARTRRAQHRDAPLRHWKPRWRTQGSSRHFNGHLAGSLHRLVS